MSLENLPKFLLKFSEREMKGEKRHSYRFKAFRLEVEERQLFHHDHAVPLTPKAFDVLVALVERNGHLVEKGELMQIVWSDSFVEEANVARLVHTLRKVLGDDGNGNKFIETVAKKGYRFVTKVNKIEEPTVPLTRTGNGNHPAAENLAERELHNPATAENNGDARLAGQNTTLNKTADRSHLTRLSLIALIGGLFAAFAAWYFLPKFFARRAPAFQTIQATRLTDTGTANMAEISADGRFVVFINQKDGKESLAVKQVATGSVITLVPPATINFYQPTFSPDSEFVYYVMVDKGVGTLYLIPALGGESRKVVTDIDSKPAISPDGKRIAFLRYNPNEDIAIIYTANHDGTLLEPFLQPKELGFDAFLAIDWSPDGEKILLGAYKNQGKPNRACKIIAVGLRNKNIEVVSDKDWFGIRGLEWIKNGSGIIIIGKRDAGENSQIWHLDYPGGAARQITTDTNNYSSVGISTDSDSIVAARIEAISGIWSIDSQSKETHQLMGENNNLVIYGGIAQMPDGKILYVKITNKEVNIFKMDESGANEGQLTSENENNTSPAVSPDSGRIVFVSNRGGYSTLWRMNADGSGALRLTTDENVTDLQPEVAPDGKTVIFRRQVTGSGNLQLMKVSIDGGQAVPLMPENRTSEYLPRISPDGRRIAYTSFFYDSLAGSVASAFKVAEFDGEKIEITSEKELKPSVTPNQYKWTPDGKSLTYISKKTGVDNLWSISIEDGTETPLTNFSVGYISDFHWSIDGQKLFIVKTVFSSNLVLIKDAPKNF
jgi:Tol biopolymer transport system component/DNA-binding winged helix-turn-helix (wHTH) protein